MGIHAHAPPSLGRYLCQLRAECAFFVEQLLGIVAAHPLVKLAQMLGLLEDLVQWNLVRAPGIFHRLAVYDFRPGPALGRAHDQHRPRWPLDCLALRHRLARCLLNLGDAVEYFVEDRRSLLVHRERIVALQRVRLIAVTAHQAFQLGVRNSRQYRRVGDLVAVQVQDR